MNRTRVLIMGAAERDFHNFNVIYRNDPHSEVVAFTATQIPNIEGRRYPPELSGELYPNGIPILDEADLSRLILGMKVDDVVFSYSDVSHEYVMHKASEVLKCGANFKLLGGKKTMIRSNKPVIAIGAVRTGSGKSQTSRRVAEVLTDVGRRVAIIRHPMPYGNLAKQKVQRFSTIEDLKKHDCTIEEMEEYEPHIVRGSVVFAGIDYGAILDKAEKEADIILWDGGNNDMPFYKPDLFLVVVDPHRPGHELLFYPGESNLLMADVLVINKVDTADPENVATVKINIASVNPSATVIEAASPVKVEEPDAIKGKRCLVVEDGPTLTHGGMKFGAGVVAAEKFGASEIVDPRPWITGTIAETFETYPDIGKLLPAMGYGEQQIKDLESTINAADCDAVLIGTPIDLRKVLHIEKPSVRVTYDLKEIGKPTVAEVLTPFMK
ncbi:MAG TPA: GTPase [Candidatus Marinimicrobia bacterium]|nr:GTPase [Candidatus Neomarinimicrobiota bacterium]HIB95611.1 GTPase [Candidatus Neomarinimicrobiota bacterium]HIN62954.1 GTPase [Candidatus Neomarinimicrobiota bacterium]HIO74899.1 GTPase [Candidatus Neomarinimicrobiota bacterium]HIO88619.1 GTPase [Candidatus Neomarinimicrobiota bacterium]